MRKIKLKSRTDFSAQLLSTATVQFHTDIHQHDAVFLETKQQQFVYFSEKATDFPLKKWINVISESSPLFQPDFSNSSATFSKKLYAL